MRALLLYVATALALSAVAPAATKSHVYSDAKCGIEFDVPPGWTAHPEQEHTPSPDALCTLVLQPGDLQQRIKRDDVDLYSINITVKKGNLDAAASGSFFEHRSEGWVVLGDGFSTSPAEKLSSRWWEGISGIGMGHCPVPDGDGVSGLCEIPTVLLNNRAQKSVLFMANPQSGPTLDLVVKSFRFIP